jgi:hypothetical protein
VNPAAQDTHFVARRETTASSVRAFLRSGIVRRSEWVILSFLLYTVALATMLPIPQSTRHMVTLINVGIWAVYPVLIAATALGRQLLLLWPAMQCRSRS